LKPLIGSKAIEKFYSRNWELILKFIREEKFPATKDKGCWVSDEELICEWHKKRVKKLTSKNRVNIQSSPIASDSLR